VVWVPSTYYVAWWNLENLFDEENSPRRSEQLQRAFGADLAGWTPARRDRKVAQLASAIAQMNGGAGLDLLEICEVENRLVVDLLVRALDARLPGCNYAVVHADTDDARGIDVASSTTRDSSKRPTTRSSSTSCYLQRNPRTRPGQLPDAHESHLGGGRKPPALAQWRPV
jgi:hypothetical protein